MTEVTEEILYFEYSAARHLKRKNKKNPWRATVVAPLLSGTLVFFKRPHQEDTVARHCLWNCFQNDSRCTTYLDAYLRATDTIYLDRKPRRVVTFQFAEHLGAEHGYKVER